MSSASGGERPAEIVLDELFAHAPEVIWRALTEGALLARWLMEPDGFAPVVGTRFTFRTRPAGAWDGLIRCEILELVPLERLVISWRSGDDANVGYGSRLDTTVTFSLTRVAGGARLRLVHAGFERPRNDTAYRNMSEGWIACLERLGALSRGRH